MDPRLYKSRGSPDKSDKLKRMKFVLILIGTLLAAGTHDVPSFRGTIKDPKYHRAMAVLKSVNVALNCALLFDGSSSNGNFRVSQCLTL